DSVAVWDMRDGPHASPAALPWHDDRVVDVLFSGSGDREVLVSGGRDGRVRAGALPPGVAPPRDVTTFGASVTRLARSPDGAVLAAAARDGVVRRFTRAADGGFAMTSELRHRGAATALAVAADGAVASGGRDGRILVVTGAGAALPALAAPDA